MSLSESPLFRLYDLLWGPALLLLKRNKRLRHGWGQRVLKDPYPGPCDLWIQAASVGEAFLAGELLPRLSNPLDRPLRILLTTNTAEGMERLDALATILRPRRSDLLLHTAYFPLDRPRLIRKAMAQVRPRTAVLLESEMWPGFMAACRDNDVDLLLVNGRMSEKSLRGYLKFPSFFRKLAPKRILAMSEADAARFAALYGHARVDLMSNIKFDRVTPPGANGNGTNPLREILPQTPFVVLASVREQEEPDVLRMVRGIITARPDAVVGLFPRHMHRIEPWQGILEEAGIDYQLRSAVTAPPAPGSVLLWDTMGEMGHAFELASAAFVGGSLAPLGGQNFLEPLNCGITPVIGPHWKNFAWIGGEIVDCGLVHVRQNAEAVLHELLALLAQRPDPEEVRSRFLAYVAERRGGAATACGLVAESLKRR
ncbi:MAG: glycosyltransferase N-terminal domain-containing protein [Desulfovibrionaceae bacterium]